MTGTTPSADMAPLRPVPTPDQLRGALDALTRSGVEYADSALTRSVYASDASVYRVSPAAVVFPRHRDDIEAVVAACTANGVSITSRGAGTSIAGNAIGAGVIIDHSRHLNRVLEIDPDARSARVQPGVVHAVLQQTAAKHGLRFGPDPSSHSRCTIGGMIGNNACGSRALGYGRTSDNVRGLHLMTARGDLLRLGDINGGGHPESRLLADLRETVAGSLGIIRTELGRFGRQVSGYALDRLLPEHGFDVAKMLVGSEGTLGVVTEADITLVRDADHRVMAVLGFENMVAAAAAVPAILEFAPIACEGLDRRITDVVERTRPGGVPQMPRGGGWLFVEFAGDDLGELEQKIALVASASDALETRRVPTAAEAAALWRIREDGSGLVARTSSGRPAHAGWEDAAVPPQHLAAYLAEFEELLETHGLFGVPYGHFGDGCVHVRIDFALDDGPGRNRYGEFLDNAAILVAGYGGSMSGEHGDGQARSSLLRHMYSPAALGLFGEVKALFDPADAMNPGIIVRPASATSDIRYGPPPKSLPQLSFGYPHDSDGLFGAVHRCTGVGRCVAPLPSANVMCPSYLATRDEKDSTRGRSRVLQDAVSGRLGHRGLSAPEVHDALELCLSCKGCRSDCPTGVDMAKFKSEAMNVRYRGRVRPRSHYSLGMLPMWMRAARRMPALVNRLSGIRLAHPAVAWLAGIDARRDVPRLAVGAELAAWRTLRAQASRPTARKDVVLFVDTFTESFTPRVATALMTVLDAAGYRVHLPPESLCCGLTWISTGQLDRARKRQERVVSALWPFVERGVPVLGLEPSCTAALRSDLPELVDDPRAEAVAGAITTLAELLSGDDAYVTPDLTHVHILAQPHCHHHAVMGWDSDRALLERAGATVEVLGGCCGLAGNFGAERGHYEVSVAVAETQLLPALRSAARTTVVLADGFSCRTQIEHLSELSVTHLAELLAIHTHTIEEVS